MTKLLKALTTSALIAAALSVTAAERSGGPSPSASNQFADSFKNKMKITIGSQTFTVTLRDNPTTAALKAMLPLTLEMKELNGNEKYFHLQKDLPTDATNPGTIQAGDLMLYESNSLVLFYKTFRTSYSYTRLGRIDDPKALAIAVGSGNVTVKFD
jgi:hypothetical protein